MSSFLFHNDIHDILMFDSTDEVVPKSKVASSSPTKFYDAFY